MRHKAPDVALQVEADYSHSLMRQLADSLLDIGVMYTPRQTPGLVIDDLFDEVEADAEVSGFASFAPSIGSFQREDVLGGTILQSNTVSGGCSQGCLQNRFLPGIDFSKWG